jgi:cell wall-associated NlpC family hydrolase
VSGVRKLMALCAGVAVATMLWQADPDLGAVRAGAGSLGHLTRPGSGERVPSTPVTAQAGRTAARYALDQRGEAYEWAAEGPNTWDCSGLTMAAWDHAGAWLPRSAAEQYAATRRIPLGQVRAGDLVFYRTSGPSGWHVAMATGQGRMVEARGRGIRVRQVPIRAGALGLGRPERTR